MWKKLRCLLVFLVCGYEAQGKATSGRGALDPSEDPSWGPRDLGLASQANRALTPAVHLGMCKMFGCPCVCVCVCRLFGKLTIGNLRENTDSQPILGVR